jgi:hypothetical protein
VLEGIHRPLPLRGSESLVRELGHLEVGPHGRVRPVPLVPLAAAWLLDGVSLVAWALGLERLRAPRLAAVLVLTKVLARARVSLVP